MSNTGSNGTTCEKPGFWKSLWCKLHHGYSRASVVKFYSNKSHRWRCRSCGREWDD